jgi:cell division protein FtsZ
MDAATRPPQPRPAAQAIARAPAAEPVRPQQQPQNSADDLFPDHKRDEQFEIPAFLRRQTN